MQAVCCRIEVCDGHEAEESLIEHTETAIAHISPSPTAQH